MLRKIKKILASYIAHKKLEKRRADTWKKIMEIHHMFD